MPRSSEESRRLFDHWAATYDASIRHTGGPLEGYDQSLAEAVALLPLPRGSRVLDIGIGTGNLAARLAEAGAQIWGVDVSEGMLARCREAHPDFSLSLGSFTALPHPEDHFDAVVSSFAFHEVLPAERPAAMAEVARVLRPGGALLLLDIIFPSPAAVENARRRLGPTWDPEEDYPLVADLDTLLRRAGFAGIQWQQTAPTHWVVAARWGSKKED